MAIIRSERILNPSARDPLDYGDSVAYRGTDYMLKHIHRHLSAGDIGNGEGQTRHANGCAVARFLGSSLLGVISLSVFRPVGGDWFQVMEGDLVEGRDRRNNLYQVAFKIDGSALYLRDLGQGQGQLRANDHVEVLLILGKLD